uniref:Uncharacterized protein n=1 Tax=Rhizophora mucronata TaxID=61149 RepID=A0A2P2PYM8_RHIMU
MSFPSCNLLHFYNIPHPGPYISCSLLWSCDLICTN